MCELLHTSTGCPTKMQRRDTSACACAQQPRKIVSWRLLLVLGNRVCSILASISIVSRWLSATLPKRSRTNSLERAAHGVDRRQRAEPRKYVRAANIPGMDDGIAAGKRRERLRPQQAMGIGNRANGSHHARPAYKRSRVRREPRAIGSATDKLPSKHPAAIPGTRLAVGIVGL